MTQEILYRPTAAVAAIRLEPGEAVRAESGAMLAMSPTVDIEARTGGFGKIVGRLLAGESMFQSRFIAARGGGEVMLAPALPGDVQAIRLEGDAYLVTSGAFLAASDNLEVNSRTRLKNFLVGESLFMLRVAGSGMLFVSAFGAIHAVELQLGETIIVDTGHLVAWSDTMDVRVGKATRSFLGSALSGEGIVATLTGPGVIYMQTRAPQALGAFVQQYVTRSQ
ncbi:TIGR00266 family protein [bacterium]|nr:MAG: TIGR00266 family protein [bacterium]